MAYLLFKIGQDEITPITQFTPRDVIMVFDDSDKKIYVYKGSDRLNLNEFEADRIYEQIVQKFLNSHIFLLYTTVIKPQDPTPLKKIKKYILSVETKNFIYTLVSFIKNIFFFQHSRDQVRLLKNFKSSNIWKKNLTNLTSIWKLSIFNLIMLSMVIVGLGLKMGIDVLPKLIKGEDSWITVSWVENFMIYVLIALLILGITAIVNLIFVFFPMRFPIHPYYPNKNSEKKDDQ